VARAYAGHNGRKDGGATATYVRAELYEVAHALAVLTGESHPLAPAAMDDPYRNGPALVGANQLSRVHSAGIGATLPQK
jgi:hypothetical protein